ncbi:23S rRNA (cytidine(2498)-2'-O)-methyltransferase RlmM [Marinobacterium alkalitolerans]|uniref:23S rRNA (cytidine(2498)-2'-O)-methyltransferase RlmM n=1 Tax=Marinobacterium alkalitolerans TaxID=1542925 RepID=UPI001ADDA9C1|nr:23S rRNA (cytidine(2498)-2'-O)-methyltransferase RlmM [Marinobacterium alkalitolerans]
MSDLNTVLLHCRGGFEKECAAEIVARSAEQGVFGYPQFEAGQAYVLFHCHAPGGAEELVTRLRFERLIFARQWCACLPLVSGLSKRDRITPLLEQCRQLPQAAELMVEVADTTEGRELQGFARKFGSALSQALRQEEILLPRKQKSDWRMHLFVIDGQTLWLGAAPARNSSPLPMGIRRLKFPHHAPSRSTLKLEEAWLHFLSAGRQKRLLAPGMTAVDLGAAPGGWTWQLVKHHMRVTAVDNGPMDEALMESGQVEHRQEDAFTFVPPKPVDWLVCDIVDKPARVTELMLRWALSGWCKQAMFNLKLPMKKRFDEVEHCLQHLEAALHEAGVEYRLRARQLYHDREEITCWLSLSEPGQ